MVIPFIVYFISILFVGGLWTIFNSPVQAFFEASMQTNAAMITFLNSLWSFFPLFYFVVATIGLMLYSRRKRGGGF